MCRSSPPPRSSTESKRSYPVEHTVREAELHTITNLEKDPHDHQPREGDDMQAQPYLFFDGRCDEALEFYQARSAPR